MGDEEREEDPARSAAVRSLYAALLGIGGWCIGALVVLTALPTVPIDDQVLAVISVGVPWDSPSTAAG